MRHEDASLQLWLANDRIARGRGQHDPELTHLAHLARRGSETPTLRQRAGKAMIAFGERLAGDHAPIGQTGRLVTRAS